MAENDVRNNEQQEDLSELIKVRRDKLRDLQDAGKDPFKEVRFDKTAMSKEIVDNLKIRGQNRVACRKTRQQTRHGQGKFRAYP